MNYLKTLYPEIQQHCC